MKKLITVALITTILCGCATRGANYIPLVDTKGKDATTLDRDTTECQHYATQRIDAASGALVGAIAGALLGAALGAGTRYRNNFAQQGAIAGGVGGGFEANQTQESIIKRCLAGRGYNVLN